jgi:hypothetical protein
MIELSMLEDIRSHLRRHHLAIANQTRGNVELNFPLGPPSIEPQ